MQIPISIDARKNFVETRIVLKLGEKFFITPSSVDVSLELEKSEVET